MLVIIILTFATAIFRNNASTLLSSTIEGEWITNGEWNHLSMWSWLQLSILVTFEPESFVSLEPYFPAFIWIKYTNYQLYDVRMCVKKSSFVCVLDIKCQNNHKSVQCSSCVSMSISTLFLTIVCTCVAVNSDGHPNIKMSLSGGLTTKKK